jgi:hypothetical protein
VPQELALAQLSEGTEGSLSDIVSDVPPDDGGTTIGQPLGHGAGIKLSEEEKSLLASECLEMIDAYESASRKRLSVEEEIEQHYRLRPDPSHGGMTSDSTLMASELLMSMVDQAHARLVENILSAEPLPRAKPLVTEDSDRDMADARADVARSTENFLHAYTMDEVRLRRLLPLAIRRAAKVGTGVLFLEWRKRERKKSWWTQAGDKKTETVNEDGVECRLVPNRDVIAYPPNEPDWQKLDLVGHRMFLSLSRWRRYAKSLGLDDEMRSSVEGQKVQGEEMPNTGFPSDERDPALDQKIGRIQVTQLYMTWVREDGEGQRLLVILSEEIRKVLAVYENTSHEQLHPYYPLRYKKDDEGSWGTGIGHEVLYCQSADVALRNLLLDNLSAGAYWFWQVKQGSTAEVLFDRPSPGQRLMVDEIDQDIKPTPAGGKAEGIDEAMADNRYRAREASGLPPVLGGQGDPTLKSGGGTGSTIALIEQAGKKWGEVDRSFREDLSDLFFGIYALVHQHAPEGTLYRFASKDDASLLTITRFQPERGKPASDLFRISVEAPNAATSKEARRHSLLTWWQFLNQHSQLALQYAAQSLGATNPAGFQEYQLQVLEMMDWTARQVALQQDLPDVASHLPKLPDPDDIRLQQINAIMQQLAQAQQQVEQLAMQNQQLMAAVQGGGMPQPSDGVPS